MKMQLNMRLYRLQNLVASSITQQLLQDDNISHSAKVLLHSVFTIDDSHNYFEVSCG